MKIFMLVVLTGTGMFDILIPYTLNVVLDFGSVVEWVGTAVQTGIFIVTILAVLPNKPKLKVIGYRGTLLSRAGDNETVPVIVVKVTNTGKVPVRVENISFVRTRWGRRSDVWTAQHWTQNATAMLLGGLTDIRTEEAQKAYHQAVANHIQHGEYSEIEALVEYVKGEHSLPKVLEPGAVTEWLIEDEGDVKDLIDKYSNNIRIVVSTSEKSYYSNKPIE